MCLKTHDIFISHMPIIHTCLNGLQLVVFSILPGVTPGIYVAVLFYQPGKNCPNFLPDW